MGRSFDERQPLVPWLSAVNRGVAMLLVVGVWAPTALVVANETRPPPWLWVIMATVGIVAGVIVPVMLWVLQLRIHLDGRLYSVRIWPTPFKSQVPRRQIRGAYSREVDPMRDYGGWGLKGKRANLLYSVGGKKAVTVEYCRKGQTHRVTVTTERADELLAALTA